MIFSSLSDGRPDISLEEERYVIIGENLKYKKFRIHYMFSKIN
jgi:hypothetical protein